MERIDEKGRIHYVPLSGVKILLLTLALVLAGGIVGFDYTITNASLQYLAGGVGTSLNNAAWFIDAFSMGNAICLALTGFLSQRFGMVKTICISLILYLIFSFLCGISRDLTTLVGFRFLQGFVAGPIIPVGQSLLLINYPVKYRNVAIAIWGFILVAAPLSAPTLGAYLSANYHWSYSFFLNIPLAIISLLIIQSILKDRETKTFRRNFDGWALFFLIIFVISLQTILTKGEQWDWWNSHLVRILSVVSIVSVFCLVVTEIGKKEPLMNFRLFKNLSFSLGNIMSVVSYMTMFAALAVMPQWLQSDLNYTPFWAGVVYLPSLIFPLILTPFLPYLLTVMRKSVITAICFLFFSISFYMMVFYPPGVDVKTIMLSRLIYGAGVIYNASLIALTFSDITKENLAGASGIFFFLRIFSGAIGAAIFQTLWERRTIFHHFRIIETVNPFRSSVVQYEGLLEHLHFFGKKKLAMMNLAVDQQAMLLAFMDVAWIGAIVCFFLIFLVLLAGQIRMSSKKSLRSEHAAPQE